MAVRNAAPCVARAFGLRGLDPALARSGTMVQTSPDVEGTLAEICARTSQGVQPVQPEMEKRGQAPSVQSLAAALTRRVRRHTYHHFTTAAALVSESEIFFSNRRISAANRQKDFGEAGLSNEQERSCDGVVTNLPVRTDDDCRREYQFCRTTDEFVLESSVSIVMPIINHPSFVLIDVDDKFAAMMWE